MKILVIGAHPDDEVLGLGATLARHTANGDEVYVMLLTNGEDSREGVSAEVIEKRKKAALSSATILGIKDTFIDSFKDQHLDTYPLVTIVKAIEKYAARIEPDIVYFHHAGDLNYDHQIVHQAALTAFRPVGSKYPHTLLTYQTPSSTEWGGADKSFCPNYYVNVTEFFDKKVEALKAYEMELRESPHPRSEESLKADAMKQGSVIGVSKAEAFMLIRKVNL